MTIMTDPYTGENLDSYLRYNREAVRAYSLAHDGDWIDQKDCFAVLQAFQITTHDLTTGKTVGIAYYEADMIYPGALVQWWPQGYAARRRANHYISKPGAWIDRLTTFPIDATGLLVTSTSLSLREQSQANAVASKFYGEPEPFPG